MVSRLAAFAVLSAALGTACTESALPEDATLPTGETNRQPIAPATTPDRDLPPTRLGKISDDIGQRFGDGFLVWESNRTGSWRIWIRRLDGSGLRQLSPDEKGRQHCCAHIAPGGGAIAYVSMATGRRAFAGPDEFGELHVISADGSSDRIIAVDAHTYYENRAAVWQSPSKLVYIGSERQTYMLDLASGQRAVLVRSPEEGFGRLLDATLGYATRGVPSFDVYLEKPRTVAPRRGLGGCQPYFSHDGRWGFWTAGGGGPFKRYDLETSAVTTLLKKGDERLPPDRGYIYFPMYSRDSRMIAFSASPGEHSHFTADYEVFVAESDPATLEILERPVRMTFDPGTDRFPDVFQVSLPLGRHTGEAPFTVRVRPPDGDTWEWTFGDGDSAAGAGAEHSYENPGAYQLLASRGDVILEGRVIVQPARPPRVLGTDIRDGRELFVRFDESVRLDNPQVRFEPRRSVRTVDVGEDGRSVRIELDEPFRGFGRMQLSGVTDAAEQPNAMSPVSLEIEPPVWPSRREGLVFLWTAGDAPNLVDDTDLGASRACSLEAHGVARLDRDFAMQADGGTFSAGVEAGGYVIRRSQATNEITLEMMLTPRGKVSDSLGVIVMSGDERGLNFALAQRRDRLFLQLRIGPRGRSYPWLELMPVAMGESQHIVVTFSAHQVTAYLDGRLQLTESEAVRGDLFHWRQRDLFFASEPGGRQPWSGALEGVAIYSRVLESDEVAENARRQMEERRRRPTVDQLVVDAHLVRTSRRPTLEEISPYREALIVHQYEIDTIVRGSAPADQLLVTQWAILDAVDRPAAGYEPGQRVRLVLEPLKDNPQLESLYVADSLSDRSDLPLYYAVEP